VSALLGGQSVLQTTYQILRKKIPAKDILVVTGEQFAATVLKQLPIKRSQLLVEPCRRDTAAAIGLVAWKVAHDDPETVLITVHSDHAIAKPAEYLRVLLAAAQMATRQPEYLITIGANPTYPETGYGYICLGAEAGRYGKDQFYQVAHFTEKPKLAKARKYVDDWRYLWNTGIFVFRVSALQQWYRDYLPHHYQIFETIHRSRSQQVSRLKRHFRTLPAISIDYGLLEKMTNLLVLPASFGWQDIGSWNVVADIVPKKSSDKRIMIEASNNFVLSGTEKIVAIVGLHDYIVVDTEDALLICPKDKSQSVKQIVTEIKQHKWHNYL
jgi:mannose-1-phosphate guanylyltransferase